MFFHPEPHRFFPATWIDVVWFPDGPGGDTFAEKSFRGPLARMLREALGYIRRNYIQEIVTKHPDRAEATRVESFPYAAVEEAVVNAIYHRGYDVREPVEVRISPEDLVVLSYPGPDRSVRLEQLQQGRAAPRRYRNRRIGEFLKELDLTEGRATGIPKMIRVMRDNGSAPLEFEFDEDHSYFMVRLLAHPAALEIAPIADPDIKGAESTSLEVRIVTALVDGPLSKSEISNRLGRAITGTLNRRVRELLQNGFIARTIPDKPRSRMQKHCVTDRGREWLESRTQPGGESTLEPSPATEPCVPLAESVAESVAESKSLDPRPDSPREGE
jgi:ATP-dependent DNA helicase RecG